MEYKGFRLRPVSKQTDAGAWSSEVVVEYLAQDDAEDLDFRSGDLFTTAREAEAAAIALGKQIIDGEHPEFRLP